MNGILVDTNIFLEILLEQTKKESCKNFLNNNIGNLNISDFSLHSVGVHLIKNKQYEVFKRFAKDVLPEINLITLPKDLYAEVVSIAKKYNLDFDDSYQCAIAKEFDFSISTMDNDFKRAKDFIAVDFI